MNIVHTVTDIRALVTRWKAEGHSVGLVPTMGFLHEGHAALMKRAKEDNDKVVVSIFVNPTQFGPNEDLDSYPRDIDGDVGLAASLGIDAVFCPSSEEMYISPRAYVNIDLLSDTLCGQSRPVHFRGVCTVVTKLFNIVTPTKAYFGEKDAQQLAIIRKMTEDLNIPVTIVGVPIVREADGLAKSSRNSYLSFSERKAATVLYRAITAGKQYITDRGDIKTKSLIEHMKAVIDTEPSARIDYVSVVDAVTMQPVDEFKNPVLVAMAVYIGHTRLIDNFSYTPPVR